MNAKKGISAIIAVIMILMITVALAGMAYVWFTTIFTGVTTSTGTAIGGGTAGMVTKVTVEAAKYTGSNTVTTTIRNTGSQAIDLGTTANPTLSVYISDIKAAFSGTTPSGTLAVGATVQFTVTNTTAMGNICNKVIRTTVGTGYEASNTIAC